MSRCLPAGGLPQSHDGEFAWFEIGTDFPSLAWVNCACEVQLRAWSAPTPSRSRFITKSSQRRPDVREAGDIVYLRNVNDGVEEWEHVIICVGNGEVAAAEYPERIRPANRRPGAHRFRGARPVGGATFRQASGRIAILLDGTQPSTPPALRQCTQPPASSRTSTISSLTMVSSVAS